MVHLEPFPALPRRRLRTLPALLGSLLLAGLPAMALDAQETESTIGPGLPGPSLHAPSMLPPSLHVRQAEPAGVGPGLHLVLLGGQNGFGGEVHRFGGVHGAWSGDRWGGGLQFHLGNGNGFRSTLVAAGPSVRIPIHARADAKVMVGGAFYGEALRTSGRTRSVVGPSGSVLVRVPVGPVHLAAGLTGWHASFSDETAVNPIPARSVRFVLGVGR